MSASRFGRYNQAGDLAPQSSAYGQAFARSRTSMHSSPLVDPHSSIEYRGFIGLFFSRAARVHTVRAPNGYGGDLPTSLQTTVDAPDPWTIPE